MSLTPAQRRHRAQIAAAAKWAREPDPSANGRHGQAGLVRKFEREIDPLGVMLPAELARRVEHARREHMLRLAWRSAKVRRNGGGAGG